MNLWDALKSSLMTSFGNKDWTLPRIKEGYYGVPADALDDEHLVGDAHPDDGDALLLAEDGHRRIDGEEGQRGQGGAQSRLRRGEWEL